jgi:hypothetical protein
MPRHPFLAPLRTGSLTLGLLLAAAGAQADAAGRNDPELRTRPTTRIAAVKLLSWRAHNICPIQGAVRTVRSIDSVGEWRDTVSLDEAGGVGRRVLWSREKALVYALALEPTTGVQLEPASSTLRLNSGVLWWPVRLSGPGTAGMPITVQSRPCLIALVNRAQWHRVRVVERRA